MSRCRAESDVVPRLSWVMIFFNGERFMDEAIASVVSQSDVDDWELVLVDDGSTDRSTEIARRWASTDPERIRYVEHEGHANRGMSAARNLGARSARGRFIGFLDCDDVLLPATMQRAGDLLENKPDVDVVIGRTLMWFDWATPGAARRRVRDRVMFHPSGVAVGEAIRPTELFRAYYETPREWSVPGTCSMVIRRDAFDRIGGFDEAFTGMFEDQVVYAKIGIRLTAFLDEQIYALYRQHATSAVALDGRSEHWFPWRRNPPQDRFLRWLERHVEQTCGAESDEAAIVRANVTWREELGSGLRRMWWTARVGVMDRAPRFGTFLRRARAGPFRVPNRPIDPLTPAERELVTTWTDEVARRVDRHLAAFSK